MLKQNQTHRYIAIQTSEGDFSDDINIKLQPGFTSNGFATEAGNMLVESNVDENEDHIFHQSITAIDIGICVYQSIDFEASLWTTEVWHNNCLDKSYEQEWYFVPGSSNIYEEVAPVIYDDIYDQGYDSGFQAGLDQAEEEAKLPMFIEPTLLAKYEEEFPAWVESENMNESIFTCDSDVRITHPFPEDDRMWALWAQQDCSAFDLVLTVLLNQEAEVNLIGWIGADLTDKGCVKADHLSEDVIACEFELLAGGDKFGMLFSGGFIPTFYTQEW